VTVAGAGATEAPLSPRSMLTAPEMSPVPPSSLDSSAFGLGAAAGSTLLRLKRCGRLRMRRRASRDFLLGWRWCCADIVSGSPACAASGWFLVRSAFRGGAAVCSGRGQLRDHLPARYMYPQSRRESVRGRQTPRQVPTKLWRVSTRVFEEPRGGQYKCQDCVGTLLYGALTLRATRGRAERDSTPSRSRTTARRGIIFWNAISTWPVSFDRSSFVCASGCKTH